MKIFRLLVILLVLGITACNTVPGTTDSLSPTEKQMLGLWEEYSPGANCAEFFSDRTMKIYFTKQEGGKSGPHYGKFAWQVDENSTLTLTLIGVDEHPVVDKSANRLTAIVSFVNGEVWMKDPEGTVTKTRRIKELPPQYKW